MQLKVIKSDSTMEQYLHTKVIGTFSNALALVEESNVFAAEQFAEAVTFHLYHQKSANMVTTDEIHLMIRAVLNATGYRNAARALNDHRLSRDIRRKRIEVINTTAGHADRTASRWNKSRVVSDLIKKNQLSGNIARAIASAVEEKVLNLGMSRIPASLIKQLVLADTEAMLNAQSQLQTIAG